MFYRVIDSAGRWLTDKGFTSYVHHDSLRFNSFDEASVVASRYKNARVEVV